MSNFEDEYEIQSGSKPFAMAAAPELEPVSEPQLEPEPVESEVVEPEQPKTEVAEEDDFSDLAPKKLSGAQRSKLKMQRLQEELAALKAKQAESPQSIDEDAFDTEVARRVREELAKEKQKEAARSAEEKWEKRKEEGRAKYGEDFDDALENAPDVQVGVLEVLRESEFGSDIAFHLATHPEEIKKLNGMSASLAARELGKLEARFEAKKQAEVKPKPVSKAPAAIATVTPARQAGARQMDDGYELY